MTDQKYKDGEYTATGYYANEKEEHYCECRAKKWKDSECYSNTNSDYQTVSWVTKKFALAISDEVVGKPVSEVHLDKLAGSSLTTKGFNDALEKIKLKASK